MQSRNTNTELEICPKIRRCVVRIKRMKTQPNRNKGRSVSGKAEPAFQKKRPAGPAKSATALSTSLKAKDKVKTPTVARNSKTVQELKKIATTLVVEELPPTIAAGRSRRAHKPNPKYANEDILTPKSFKLSTVTNLDDKASNDSENESSRGRKASKTSKHIEIDSDSDSDFQEDNEDSDTSIYEKTARNRPSKNTADPSVRRSIVGAANVSALNKTAPNTKAVPTQLQQLRRTLNANNLSPLAMSKKRKLEESNSSTSALAAKRPNLSGSTTKLTDSNGIVKRGPSTISTENESKIKSSGAFSAERRDALTVEKKAALTADRRIAMLSEKKSIISGKRKSASPLTLTRSSSVANFKNMSTSKIQQNSLQRGLINRSNLSKSSSISTPSLSRSSTSKTPNSTPPSTSSSASKSKGSLSKTTTANKQQSSATSIASKNNTRRFSSSDETQTITIDDFETMPTFTIVNINDIINKKGDVLMSEAAADSQAEDPKKSEKLRDLPKQSQPNKTPPQQSKALSQQSKLQAQQSKQHNKSLAKKQSSDSAKEQQSLQFTTSTPLMKKPAENSALSKIINRNSSGAAKTSPSALKRTASSAATKPTTRGGASNSSEKKPAPRILNSVVSPRTKPIKPVIANLDISDDDPSGSVSLYTDDDDEDGDGFDDDINDITYRSDSDYSANDSEIIESPKKRVQSKKSTTVGKKIVSTPPKAAKENSAAVNNCLPKKQATQSKPQLARKLSPEKVVVQREGNKIIKKITCFETWFVINIPADAPEEYERNTLDIPLIELANSAKAINLPSDIWTTKVTLYELRKTINKSSLPIYTGDLTEQNIKESERANYQPSCVMFRRTVPERVKLSLPYDRAVIFKNKTFFTNIEGKNVKLVGAPTTIKDVSEIETLLNIVDGLTLQSSFVEPAATIL